MPKPKSLQKSINIEIAPKSKKWLKINEIEKFISIKTNNIIDYSPLKPYKKNIEFELGISLCCDSQIKKINQKYRNIDKATDVLSFGNLDENIIKKYNLKTAFGNNKYIYLGDILLSYEYITKQSKIKKINFHDHLLHLILHGFLHLLGYDHQIKIDEEKMQKLEINILKKFKIQNPYL